MTTSAAENLAGRAGDKDKAEKRRALGRGLESLLPGPRVVGGAGVRPAMPPTHGPVPRATVAPAVRNDEVGGVPIDGTIQAVVEGGAAELRSAGQPGAAVPTRFVLVS